MLTYTGTQALDGYTIPIGTTFQAVKDGTTYYFRTYETSLVNQTSTGRYWTQVYLREGTMMTERWTQDADRTTRFVLPANNVDLSTLTVKVYESVSDNAGRYFQETKNIIQFATELPALYTVIENTDGNVELIFGDGVLAKAIEPGNIDIQIDNAGIVIKGTPLNNSFNEFIMKKNSLDDRFYEVNHEESRMIMDGKSLEEVHNAIDGKRKALTEEMNQLTKGFIKDNYDNVLGPGLFIMIGYSLPYPMLTPLMKEIIDSAPEKFTNDFRVKAYIDAAEAHMK